MIKLLTTNKWLHPLFGFPSSCFCLKMLWFFWEKFLFSHSLEWLQWSAGKLYFLRLKCNFQLSNLIQTINWALPHHVSALKCYDFFEEKFLFSHSLEWLQWSAGKLYFLRLKCNFQLSNLIQTINWAFPRHLSALKCCDFVRRNSFSVTPLSDFSGVLVN